MRRLIYVTLILSLLLLSLPLEVSRGQTEPTVNIPVGANWRYFKGTGEPPSDWAAINFDDSSWALGPSGFGYGDGDDATILSDMRGKYLSLYIRHTFTVSNPASITQMILSMDYDDGFVAYLNGVPVARSNVNGIPPAYNSPANANHEASGGDLSPGSVENYDISGAVGLLVSGTNVVAIQGHNLDPSSSDFSLIPSLKGYNNPPEAQSSSAPLPIRRGDTWRYFKGVVKPPAGWNRADFDDSGWHPGPSGFGYGDGDDATALGDMQGNYLTVYARRTFAVDDPMRVTKLVLSVDYDDGFVAYLNGIEVARSNVSGSRPAYNTSAKIDHEAAAGDADPQPEERFNISPFIGLLLPGTNVLAVQGHNVSSLSSDFSLIPTLEAIEAPPSSVLFEVARGATWRYFKGTGKPPASWKTGAFDDSTWPSGPSGFGYGDRDDATVLGDMRGNYLSVYIRHTFTVIDPAEVARMFFLMDYDDGFVAYLNGVEVLRSNVNGSPPAYNTPATRDHEAAQGDTSPRVPKWLDFSSLTRLLVPGVNVLAVQGHNVSRTSSDFSLIPGLLGTRPLPLNPTLVRQPYLQLPGTDGMTIVWATWDPGHPSVRYGLDWTSPGFDDSSWPAGASGFGYDDGDDATILSDMKGNYLTVYARHTFDIATPAAVRKMVLSVDYDDGFVAYLNGVEVARSLVKGVRPAHDTSASAPHEASGGDLDPQPVAVFDLRSFTYLLRPGNNVLAVQGHNAEIDSSDFSLIPSLTLHSPEPIAAISPGDQWRYFKGTTEPLALSSTATGISTFYPVLSGYYQHEVTLRGLEPGTRYSYRTYLEDIELYAGDTLSFRTASNAPGLTFIAFGDSGTGKHDQLAVRDQLLKDRADLVIMPGDVSQELGTYAQLQRTFFDVYPELLKQVPFVPVAGNHDYMTNSGKPFRDLFVLPSNGAAGWKERYFSFNYGNVHFVALDTELVGKRQADWLQSDLAGNTQFWTVVYLHRSPFGEGSNHPMTESADVRTWFTPHFEKYGVDLVLAGHNAIYGRSVPLIAAGPDSPYATATTGEAGGVVYVTTGGGGDTLDRPYTDSFYQPPGATFSAHHYTKVTVSGCTLTLTAVHKSGKTRDSFTIDRCP